MKKWKLTCRYLGATASELCGERELTDQWTLVQLGEVVNKGDGGQFEDAGGPTDGPLTWKDGQATETGCGPWWRGFEESSVAYCDRLLTRAGMPTLVRGATLADTFDIDGPNADALDALDRAEWTMEALPAAAPPG